MVQNWIFRSYQLCPIVCAPPCTLTIAMYLPEHFAESRIAELQRVVREHPLGIVVTHTCDGLDANHIPFELDDTRGAFGTLLAHIARANPLSGQVEQGAQVMVIFRGAQGYISPNWYPSKQETHRHVPTWNYEVVHAHGRMKALDDERFVRGVVARLTRQHEMTEPHPWKIGDAPQEYIDQMLKQIVGIEIEVTRMEGKRKLSQNRDRRDFESVVRTLKERGNESLAGAMMRKK
jgi:transcriptional regulator